MCGEWPGGKCGCSGEYGAWGLERILDCPFAWSFQFRGAQLLFDISYCSDSTVGQIIKEGRKQITAYCRGNVLEKWTCENEGCLELCSQE